MTFHLFYYRLNKMHVQISVQIMSHSWCKENIHILNITFFNPIAPIMFSARFRCMCPLSGMHTTFCLMFVHLQLISTTTKQRDQVTIQTDELSLLQDQVNGVLSRYLLFLVRSLNVFLFVCYMSDIMQMLNE